MAKKGVLIAGNMASTKLPSLLRSIRFYEKDEAQAIENGHIVTIGQLEEGQREIYKGTAVAAETDPIVFVDGVELMYDETLTQGRDDFENPAGVPLRGRVPHVGDIVEVSEDCITATEGLKIGNIVTTPASGTKLVEKVDATGEDATGEESFVGEIIEKYVWGARAIPMVAIKVRKAQ